MPMKPIEPCGTTLAVGFQQYIDEHVNVNTKNLYGARLGERHALAFFGADKDLATIRKPESAAFGVYLKSMGMADGSVNRLLAVTRAMLGHAEEFGRLDKAPKFKKMPTPPPRRRFLTSEECEAVMKAAREYVHIRPEQKHRIYYFFAIALEAPARSKAIEELTVDRVDFERRMINFCVPGKVYRNKRRNPSCPISSHLLPILKEACDGKKPTDFVIGPGCSTYYAAKVVCRRAGVNERFVARHVCRKTWASHAAINNVPTKKIAMVLADSPKITDEHYAHLTAEHTIDAMEFRKAAPAVEPAAPKKPRLRLPAVAVELEDRK